MLPLGPLVLIGLAKAFPFVARMAGDFLKTPEGKTALKLGGTMLKDKGVTEHITKSVKDAIDDMGEGHYINDGWTICSPENLQGIDIIDAGNGILIPIPHVTTRLFRTYSLPSGATIEGVRNVIESYFRKCLNTGVSSVSCDFDSYLIKAKTKIKLLAACTDFNVEVFLSKGNSSVEVHYLEGTNNLENTLQAAFLDNPLKFLCKLFGVAYRLDIPLAINESVQAYLKEVRRSEADKKWEVWLKCYSK